MKTVNNNYISKIGGLCLIGIFVGGLPAYAQVVGGHVPSVAPAQPAIPPAVLSPTLPSLSAHNSSASSVDSLNNSVSFEPQASSGINMPFIPPALDSGGDIQDKAQGSLKGIIRRLDNGVDAPTLGDLNAARQAIAKVELLIELEKKMSELEKVRQDRENKSMSPVISPLPLRGGGGGQVIPQPVLPNPVPISDPTPALPPSVDDNIQDVLPSVEIIRIVGGAGRYGAVIIAPDGSNKTISIGDTISSGFTVTAITPVGLTLERKGKVERVQIKNAGKVFGSTP